MILPNADQAVIPPEKLHDYLLSPTHPVGRFKAVFFQTIGYDRDNWREFETAIRSLLRLEANEVEQTDFGKKYKVSGDINSPSGRKVNIVAIWIVLEGESIPRFITAYPGGKK
ncbi:MAG: DUF6883 domain-containing protein [Desulfosudaceae bacterium]